MTLNVLALAKPYTDEKYIFLYDDESALEMMHKIWRYAADRDLSLNAYDAACLTERCARKTPNDT